MQLNGLIIFVIILLDSVFAFIWNENSFTNGWDKMENNVVWMNSERYMFSKQQVPTIMSINAEESYIEANLDVYIQ